MKSLFLIKGVSFPAESRIISGLFSILGYLTEIPFVGIEYPIGNFSCEIFDKIYDFPLFAFPNTPTIIESFFFVFYNFYIHFLKIKH